LNFASGEPCEAGIQQGKDGGEKLLYFQFLILFPLPPPACLSKQACDGGQALSPLARGGESEVSTYTNSCEAGSEFDIEMTRTRLG
jgi:hypothetical protein